MIAWTTARAMAALIVAMSISRFAYTPILPSMLTQHAVSHEQGALLASSNLLGYLVGAMVAAHAFFGTRIAASLRLSLAINVLAIAMMLAPHAYSLWLTSRFISGASSAFVFVFATASVLALGRPRATTALFSSIGIGIAITGILIPIGYSIRSDWTTGWVIALDVALLLALFAAWPGAGVPVPATHHQATETAGRGSKRTFVLVTIAYGASGFSYVVPATFLVALLTAIPSLAGYAARSWVLVGLTGAVSIAAWSEAARRFGKERMLAAALLLLAVACVAPVVERNVIGAIVVAIGLGGSFMGITMLGVGVIRDLDPHKASTQIGIATTAFGLGQVLGPLFTGYSYDRTGQYAESLVAAATLVTIGAILVLIDTCRFSADRV
jgi:predicted MFS family arabinose efflux permease